MRRRGERLGLCAAAAAAANLAAHKWSEKIARSQKSVHQIVFSSIEIVSCFDFDSHSRVEAFTQAARSIGFSFALFAQ